MADRKYNTIVFDLDGTLLNTLTDLTNSLNYSLDKFGIKLATEYEVRQNLGNGYYRLITHFLPDDKKDLLEQVHKVFAEHYKEHCNDFTKPYPGILELLHLLKDNGYKIAIVSNKNGEAVKKLAELHFSSYVDCAIGVSEKVRKKPDKDLVQQSLIYLSSDINESVYVGDSEVDIQTAKNSSLNCISVSWGFRSVRQLLISGASLIIDKPMDLIKYV